MRQGRGWIGLGLVLVVAGWAHAGVASGTQIAQTMPQSTPYGGGGGVLASPLAGGPLAPVAQSPSPQISPQTFNPGSSGGGGGNINVWPTTGPSAGVPYTAQSPGAGPVNGENSSPVGRRSPYSSR